MNEIKFPTIRKIKSEIAKEVSNIAKEKNCNYMEAVIIYCEKNSVDIEQAGAIIKNNRTLVNKLKSEAKSLNFLK